jgi:transcriptional regulator with XRE-family HTH domain
MDKEKIKGVHYGSTHRKYLYNFRKKNRYTMFQVSEMIDMSKPYYERIEKGIKGQRLSLKTAYKLATLLQIDLNKFYDLEEQYQQDQNHD